MRISLKSRNLLLPSPSPSPSLTLPFSSSLSYLPLTPFPFRLLPSLLRAPSFPSPRYCLFSRYPLSLSLSHFPSCSRSPQKEASDGRHCPAVSGECHSLRYPLHVDTRLLLLHTHTYSVRKTPKRMSVSVFKLEFSSFPSLPFSPFHSCRENTRVTQSFFRFFLLDTVYTP